MLSLGQDMQCTDMTLISEKAKHWITKLLKSQVYELVDPLTHSFISERSWNSTDTQGRSCLSSFERLMRHVWLWEYACDSDVILDNTTFASVDYAEMSSPVGYDETPHYAWDENFRFADFEAAILKVNHRELIQFRENMSDCGYAAESWRRNSDRPSFTELVKDSEKIRRMVIKESLEEVLSPDGDTLIPLWIPESFVTFANEMISRALVAHCLPQNTQPLYSALNNPLEDSQVAGDLRPFYWKIDDLCAWQKIDRRIDEIYEVLWAFRSAHAVVIAEQRLALFITELSKRAIRKGPDDEIASFARWIGRVPNIMRFSYSGNWYEIVEESGWKW